MRYDLIVNGETVRAGLSVRKGFELYEVVMDFFRSAGVHTPIVALICNFGKDIKK